MSLWESPIEVPSKYYCVGIDPGRHLGLAYYYENILHAFHIYPTKQENTFATGIQLMEIVRLWYKKYIDLDNLTYCVVEGGSFNERYGQDNLSQIRFALSYAAWAAGIDTITLSQMPPASARKQAFGSGTTSAKNLWPNINNNAADATGLALAAFALSGQPEESK